MNKCIKCGSYAFNLYKEGIDQGGLCDVHYWQGRAHRAEALAQPKQERKPLTDEQIIGIARVTCIGISPHEDTVNLVRAIEAAHGIKE